MSHSSMRTHGSQFLTVLLVVLLIYVLSYILFRERNKLGFEWIHLPGGPSDLILVDSEQKRIMMIVYKPLFLLDHQLTKIDRIDKTYK